MRIEGILIQDTVKGGWTVTVPALLAVSEGQTKKEAFAMIKDAVEELVNKKGFKVRVIPGKGTTFYVKANQPKILIAFMLKQLRGSKGLSIKDVTLRLGVRSLNSYAQFEQGKCMPTLEKIDELLCAIDPELEPILKVGGLKD